MDVEKCSQCGAVLVPDASGRTAGCTFCGVGVKKPIDPAALALALSKELADIHKFVEKLSDVMEASFPNNVKVERSGFFSKHVAKLEIEAENWLYTIEVDGKKAIASRSHAVRGVKLKGETLQLHKWLEQLSMLLSKMADESQAAHAALSRFGG